MTIAERFREAILASPELSGVWRSEKPPRTLITDEPWDCYHLESLLPLKEAYRENTNLGFLLRHYWIPATVLTFRKSSRVSFPDGREDWAELRIERRMAGCRSNDCLWREKVWPVVGGNGKALDSDTVLPVNEMLCSYDRYEQTYASDEPVLFKPPSAAETTDARRTAIHRLPMLVPPGPVLIGRSWHAKVGDDYMNYQLETEKRVGETSVLVVRREGRYTIWMPGGETYCEGSSTLTSSNGPVGRVKDDVKMVPLVTQRHGVTLFAWNRGTVLEDRFLDRVVQAGDYRDAIVGVTNQVVTRLIRSRPEHLVEPVLNTLENNRVASCAERKARECES